MQDWFLAKQTNPGKRRYHAKIFKKCRYHASSVIYDTMKLEKRRYHAKNIKLRRYHAKNTKKRRYYGSLAIYETGKIENLK